MNGFNEFLIATTQLTASLALLAEGCKWTLYHWSDLLSRDERTSKKLMDIASQLSLHCSLRISIFPISKGRKE